MMIESMAGKSASMHGLVHDATPFTFSEDVSAIDYFGKMLIEGRIMFEFQNRLSSQHHTPYIFYIHLNRFFSFVSLYLFQLNNRLLHV